MNKTSTSVPPNLPGNQTAADILFASDWMTYVDEDLDRLLSKPLPPPHADGAYAQVIGTGPTVRYSAMPELFESLMFAARREIVITTPYYVPDEALQNALCTTAYRGVDTTIVFPARNDSWIVGAASRSYYVELLNAGVKIFEYEDGLLHTKSVTLDGEVTLIGSANMDRRSFDLNFENNILVHDAMLTGVVRERQQDYIARSRGHSGGGGSLADVAPAVEQPNRHPWSGPLKTCGPYYAVATRRISEVRRRRRSRAESTVYNSESCPRYEPTHRSAVASRNTLASGTAFASYSTLFRLTASAI